MRRFAFCFLGMIGGYILGAVAGYAFVSQTSANTHDRTVEAGMTGAFISGPIGAIACGIAGFVFGSRRN